VTYPAADKTRRQYATDGRSPALVDTAMTTAPGANTNTGSYAVSLASRAPTSMTKPIRRIGARAGWRWVHWLVVPIAPFGTAPDLRPDTLATRQSKTDGEWEVRWPLRHPPAYVQFFATISP